MAKVAFAFHAVSAEWGKDLPDGDYTVGRGKDPRTPTDEASGSGEKVSNAGDRHGEKSVEATPRDERASAAE